MTNPRLLWQTGGGQSLVSSSNGFTLMVARSGASGCIKFVVMTVAHGNERSTLVCAGIRRSTREAMAAAERIGLAFEHRRVARGHLIPKPPGSIAWLTTLPQYRGDHPSQSAPERTPSLLQATRSPTPKLRNVDEQGWLQTPPAGDAQHAPVRTPVRNPPLETSPLEIR
jgi:hypothetical protein